MLRTWTRSSPWRSYICREILSEVLFVDELSWTLPEKNITSKRSQAALKTFRKRMNRVHIVLKKRFDGHQLILVWNLQFQLADWAEMLSTTERENVCNISHVPDCKRKYTYSCNEKWSGMGCNLLLAENRLILFIKVQNSRHNGKSGIQQQALELQMVESNMQFDKRKNKVPPKLCSTFHKKWKWR